LSFTPVFCMWSLGFVATELEQPFGIDQHVFSRCYMQEDMNHNLLMLLQPTTLQVPRLARGADADCNKHKSFRDIWTELGGEVTLRLGRCEGTSWAKIKTLPSNCSKLTSETTEDRQHAHVNGTKQGDLPASPKDKYGVNGFTSVTPKGRRKSEAELLQARMPWEAFSNLDKDALHSPPQSPRRISQVVLRGGPTRARNSEPSITSSFGAPSPRASLSRQVSALISHRQHEAEDAQDEADSCNSHFSYQSPRRISRQESQQTSDSRQHSKQANSSRQTSKEDEEQVVFTNGFVSDTGAGGERPGATILGG